MNDGSDKVCLRLQGDQRSPPKFQSANSKSFGHNHLQVQVGHMIMVIDHNHFGQSLQTKISVSYIGSAGNNHFTFASLVFQKCNSSDTQKLLLNKVELSEISHCIY